VHPKEIESAVVIERPSRTAETEVAVAVSANAVAQDSVQRIVKDSPVNFKRPRALFTGM
jgi:hypothetical protein